MLSRKKVEIDPYDGKEIITIDVHNHDDGDLLGDDSSLVTLEELRTDNPVIYEGVEGPSDSNDTDSDSVFSSDSISSGVMDLYRFLSNPEKEIVNIVAAESSSLNPEPSYVDTEAHSRHEGMVELRARVAWLEQQIDIPEQGEGGRKPTGGL